VNCPKCGFVQEERADCRKCGVVFARFHALRAQESAAWLDPGEQPRPSNGFSQEPHPPELPALLEFRRNLRELQQRYNELEFERAERRRIRGEVLSLGERLQEGLGQITSHQEKIQQHAAKLAELTPSPSLHDFTELRMEVRALDVGAAHRRIEQVESRLQACTQALAAIADARLIEFLPKLSDRLNGVEGRIAALAETISGPLGNGAAAQLEATLTGLEEMKAALQNVTLRYIEIGELKKNHLVLRDMVESLQRATEGFRRETTNGNAGRVAEIDKEVSALKAEVRKAYERMDLLEAQAPQATMLLEAAPLKDLASLREEVAAAGRLHAEERLQMRSALSALEVKVDDSLQTLGKLPANLESLSSQVRHMDQKYQPLSQNLERMSNAANEVPQRLADIGSDVAALRAEFLQTRSQMKALEEKLHRLAVGPQPGSNTPAQGDMHTIRENLDEIRRFMAALSHKL